MKINLTNSTIEMTKAESKSAGKVGSEQYDELITVMKNFPDFKIEIIKRTAKRNDTFKGLTIAYMEKYIKLHDNAEVIMVEFNTLRGEVENKDELTQKATYGKIKKWFLAKYPEIKAARNEIDKIVNNAA